MLEAVFYITALTLVFAAPSFAVTDTVNINKREAVKESALVRARNPAPLHQRKMPKKDAKLNVGQPKIDRMEDKANVDGHVTKH